MPDKGTVVPLPPTAKRLEEAKALETPQSFVPGTSVSAGQSWQAAKLLTKTLAKQRREAGPTTTCFYGCFMPTRSSSWRLSSQTM